ncbi:alpha/beta fold hydrolase [Actinacidiphila yeochonensis]|uniref:alpha/beta fold hydrolase n=1 Tax=Actinacidiphila yeochonensis TaxID=89050 RepID=UPI0005636323|nr:alpha/beta hydrolase [Actinacidiphila yeochonensis]
MSRPSTLDLPRNVTAGRLATTRGTFAVLDGAPAAGGRKADAAGDPAEGGGGRGVVLLVPGFTGSKEDFLDLLALLTGAGYRAVAVDGRGQYETPGPRDEAAYAQTELAEDMLAQTAALAERYGVRPGGPALHAVGHSLGGHLLRAAVLTAAARGAVPYSSVTLMSSGPAAVTEEQQARTRLLVDYLPSVDMETAWRAMNATGGPDRSAPGPASDTDPAAPGATAADGSTADGTAADPSPTWLADFLHRRWMGTVPEQLMATARQLMTETDRVAELAAVPVPKLVLSGEQDYAWPVPWLDEMAVRLRARRVVVKGAEHSPNAERPEETAAALLDFWAGAEEADDRA